MLALALGLAFAMSFTGVPQQVFGLLWVALLLVSAAVAPVVCYHTVAGFRGPSDADGGGGPGSGPPPGPEGPSPRGIPLLDADQARTRRRDHNRPSLGGSRHRRPAVEPVRRRAPTGPGRRYE